MQWEYFPHLAYRISLNADTAEAAAYLRQLYEAWSNDGDKLPVNVDPAVDMTAMGPAGAEAVTNLALGLTADVSQPQLSDRNG